MLLNVENVGEERSFIIISNQKDMHVLNSGPCGAGCDEVTQSSDVFLSDKLRFLSYATLQSREQDIFDESLEFIIGTSRPFNKPLQPEGRTRSDSKLVLVFHMIQHVI